MKKTAIIMSTYNGEKYIREQIDSILNQDTDVDLYVRDDGSTDGTISILEEYRKKKLISLILGDNIGIVSSFFELLSHDKLTYNYYAFADQDDVWYVNKISKAIEALEGKICPSMYYSEPELVDSNLMKLGVKYRNITPSFNNALVENTAVGCTVVINDLAKDLIIRNKPQLCNIVMHDWWIYLVITALGEVVYDNMQYVKYRQHENNYDGRNYGIRDVLDKLKRALNSSKYPALELQLLEFDKVYGEHVDSNKKNLVLEFLEILGNKNTIKFVIFIFMNRVLRKKRMENLNLVISYILGRLSCG